MNTFTLNIILLGLSIMLYVIARDLIKVLKEYSVTHNGSRWVVRDNKGRFVIISKSFWDVVSLGDDL